ncbi:MAG TPA: type I secretion system permease/ATPase [Azospirillaceae bacterium]|nr:type I secretion system permease/ATPase [Azospirillaceae bacterium]
MTPKKPKTELQLALGECKDGFAIAAAFSFFINLLMLVSPLYMLQVYDRVLTARSGYTLVMLTVLALFLLGVMGGLEFLRSQVLVRIGNRIDTRLAERLFTAVYKRSLALASGSRTQPLSDLLTLRQFLTGQGLFAFFDAPWAPLFIIVIFMMHPLLGMVALGGGVALFALALLMENVTRQPLQQANVEAMRATGFAETNLRNAEVLEAMGMLPGMRSRWYASQQKMLALQSLASDRAGVVSAITKFTRLVIQTLILGVGAWLAIKNEITPGMMIASSIIMGRALAPVEQAIGVWKLLIAARGAYSRLTELLEKIPAVKDRMQLPAPTGTMTLEGVVAVPPGGQQPTLRGITLQFNAGEAIGVIGPSAAGKSTLARLIVGVWPAYAGKVRLDGADIQSWDRELLGPHMGYLPQDVELFNGTVAENIARFAEVDAEAVVEAARKAGVHEMILRLAQGYDTQIGEGGSVLSAGQRQRIGLARALYGDPKLVVLDEPNSNLDDEGEAALNAAIMELKGRGRTAIIIAHRPSVLAAVDRIVVLRDGQVQMFGPRQEVLSKFVRPVATPVQAPPQQAAQAPGPVAPAGALSGGAA